MRILLVGSGAREHALAWKLGQSHLTHELVALPGNPGFADLAERATLPDVAQVEAVADFAEARRFDLVVVGPEAPLAAGLVDLLDERHVPSFGPTRKAARLESSKAFAKEVMSQAGVATARAVVANDGNEARVALDSATAPYVVKADGLAAGKGVLVTDSLEDATGWADRCFGGGFGAAGNTVVIEEFLDGPEISVFALCDGSEAALLAPAQDYKRLRDDDEGPNTGGMGSFSPVPAEGDAFTKEILNDVVRPVLRVMEDRGTPFTGVLYAGLVVTDSGPKVLEFNVRLGDPEAQVVLPRLDADLVELMLACRDGNVGTMAVPSSDTSAVNVVLAADGYPESPRKGDTIDGLTRIAGERNVLVFHAGTADPGGSVITDGGRVMSVVGLGSDVEQARARAYQAVEAIHFEGMQYRHDIAGNV